MAANAPRPRPVCAGHPRAGGGVNGSGAAATDSRFRGANRLVLTFTHAHLYGDTLRLAYRSPDGITHITTANYRTLGNVERDPAPQRPAAQPPDPDSDDTEP